MHKPEHISKKEQEGRRQPKQAWRPKSMDTSSTGSVCPFCNSPVNSDDAICGHCGRSLIVGKCSFCGSPVKPNAKFCTRCGQSREGVRCPECGTLNPRNFCRKCNAPLTPMAIKAKEEANNDPKFKTLQKRAEELAALHARIEELNAGSSPGLSDEDRALLNEYADILSSLSPGGSPIKSSEPKNVQPQEKQAEAQQYGWDFNIMSLDDLMKAYHEKVDEMNRALAEMAPPPDYTPEQQRDYYAARKIASLEAEIDLPEYNSMLWKCNYCGCLHNAPPECCSPELGGTWIYITPEEYIARNPHLATYNYKLNIT